MVLGRGERSNEKQQGPGVEIVVTLFTNHRHVFLVGMGVHLEPVRKTEVKAYEKENSVGTVYLNYFGKLLFI